MKKRGANKIWKYLICICLFSFLMLTGGREKAQAETIMCTVRFSGFHELNTEIPKGTKLVLPKLENTDSYKYTGWDYISNGVTTTRPFGSTVRVMGNVMFYPHAIKLCRVSFANFSGVIGPTYQPLCMSVEPGTEITLPEGTRVKGYVNQGWCTVKGKIKPLYQIGEKFTVEDDVTFYIIRKAYYSASFKNWDGSSGTYVNSLKKNVYGGTRIKLPEGAAKANYVFKGWATTVKAAEAEYAPGTVYTVNAAVTFYAVYVPEVTVKYKSNDGTKTLSTLKIEKGAQIKLSGHIQNGYTMMGWSQTPKQNLNPQYKVEQTVKINKSVTLYAVLFDRKKEINYTQNTIPQIDLRKYTKVIFVGDSRTGSLQQALENEFTSSVRKGVSYVSKNGKGLVWFKGSGYKMLLDEIGAGGTKQKPIAVIFNLGINDLGYVTDYISYMNEIAPELKAKNCVLYYMSINPVNNAIITARGAISRPENVVRNFNSKIKSLLCTNGSYGYIDTYTELYKKGFAHLDQSLIKDDGLHFTPKTSKQIYAFVVNRLNADAVNRR